MSDYLGSVDWTFVVLVALVYFFLLRARHWRARYYAERHQHAECHKVFEVLLRETGQDGMLMILNPEADAHARRQ